MADEPATPAAEEPAAPTPPAPEEGVNQGAAGSRPLGESPLAAQSHTDAFAERPEAFVGAAFAGGFVLALLMRRWAR